MMRFGPRIELITSPTMGGCATNYATDAKFLGFDKNGILQYSKILKTHAILIKIELNMYM